MRSASAACPFSFAAGLVLLGLAGCARDAGPAAPPSGLVVRRVASTTIAGGGEDRAEICAFHAPSARLFVANSADRRVEVVDLSDPSRPRELEPIEVATSRERELGSPNSVALHGDWLAVAIQARDPRDPGVVQFREAPGGRLLREVEVGALPDMVTFDRAGRRCVVACEGEPSDGFERDPEGMLAIIDIPPGGPVAIGAADVRRARFSHLDAQADELALAGVRLAAPAGRARLAQALEPEFVAVAPDGSRAYAICQENNALAVIDLERGVVVSLVGLGTKDWSSPDLVQQAELERFEWPALPPLGRTSSGESIRLGGFSGLGLESADEQDGRLGFVAAIDRGPHLGKVEVGGEQARVLALPDDQPRIVRFELDPARGRVTLVDRVPLARPDGTPLTGRPNLTATRPGLAFHDESIVDPEHEWLELDPFGVDLEGIAVAPDGSFWLADEYRPSLAHFDAAGRLVARHVPIGSNAHGSVVGTETLPRVYASRRFNRGFEALAIDASTGRVYAWVQSPLDNPDTEKDRTSRSSRQVRVLELDPAAGAVTGEYVHVLDGGSSDKVCAATWSGTSGEFLVLERNGGSDPHPIQNVYRVRLDGATNLISLGDAYEEVAGVGGALESASVADLGRLARPVRPVSKALFVNLVDAGYRAGKPEGLARLPDGRLLVVDDDDFGLSEPGATGSLAVVRPLPVRLDVPDVSGDGPARLESPRLLSYYQPDAILAFEHEGETFLVTANEGELREVDGDPGFADAAPAAALGYRGFGSLLVERPEFAPGERDMPVSFGARSFSVWTTDGRQLFDSGDSLAHRLRSSGVAAGVDVDGPHGVEPESLALGELDGRALLFVGVEGAEAVLAYALDNPRSPTFLAVVETPGHRDPEGLCFVPPGESPSGAALLIVCHAETGTVTVHALDP